jgi:PilZ domain
MDKAMPDGSGPQSSRQRKSVRVPMKAEVHLRRSGQSNYLVNVHDISPEGCKLEFVERPRLDETVWVKFDGLDAVEAIVCWLKGSEAGIEFTRPIYPAVFDILVSRLVSE